MISRVFIISLGTLLLYSYTAEATNSIDLSGMIVNVFTPYVNNTSGVLNFNIIPEYAQYLKSNNIKTIIVLGTAQSALDYCDKRALAKTWVEVAKPLGFTVIVLATLLPSQNNYNLIKYFASIGVDGIAFVPSTDYIFKPTSIGRLIEYMQFLSEAAPSTPILYVHRPRVNGVYLSMAQFYPAAVQSLPNFVGIQCNLQTALNVTAFNTVGPNQYILVFGYTSVRATFALGFKSSVTAVANAFPNEVQAAMNPSNVAAQARLNQIVAPVVELSEFYNLLIFIRVAAYQTTCIKFGIYYPYLITYQQRRNLTIRLQELGVNLKCPVV